MLPRRCFVLVLLLATAPGFAEPETSPFPTGPECAARMTVPPGFKATCFASEPQIVKPIAMDIDERGRVWVLECLSYPQKLPPGQGRDRIKILEDTNGDGVCDKVTLFADKLNLATGLAIGHGGVFVGEAPELVFLEDTNGDGVADKRTVLLDGWGYQDTHETLNSFIWGPDGWLYGCHGVFTHSNVGRPGAPPGERKRINAGIWRYHPLTHKFEVFAEGTSNPWGWDYDENGSGFLTCCVIPHLFHTVSGGIYARQAGQSFHPHTYGYIQHICDHVHYFGGGSHEGNADPRRLQVGGGHAHAGCLIYQGGAFPEKWNGRIFMNNLHGARINTDILEPRGSTYVGKHGDDFLIANDPNFRVVSLKAGPDGSIWMVDWYDPQICHNTDPNVWNRSYGRIHKVSFPEAADQTPVDFSKLNAAGLVQRLGHRNAWHWRRALLTLGERQDQSVVPELLRIVAEEQDHRRVLRALWALAHLHAHQQPHLVSLLRHENEWVRAWAIRLLSEKLDWSNETWEAVTERALLDPSAVVMQALASACIRWNQAALEWHNRLKLSGTLGRRFDASGDHALPQLIWLADEPNFKLDKSWSTIYKMADPQYQCVVEPANLQKILEEPNLVRDFLTPRRMRRLASGTPEDLALALQVLQHLKHPAWCNAALDGLLEGLRGRRLEPPADWQEVLPLFEHYKDQPAVLFRLQRLGVHFGDPQAVAAMEQVASDGSKRVGQRREALQALALARTPSSLSPLLGLALNDSNAEVQREALRALAAFDSPEVSGKLLAGWEKLSPPLRREVINLLCSRPTWARPLLESVRTGQIPRTDLTENDVRRILAFQDAELAALLEKSWGKLRERTPANIEEQMNKLRHLLTERAGDRAAGKVVFEKTCATCHKLFGAGHAVGPELTGANRRDPEYLLQRIIDPNRIVGREYLVAVVQDVQGRTHSGIVVEDSDQRVVLKKENEQTTIIPRGDIEQMKVTDKGLMPEGLPDTLSESDFCDLIAYVMEDSFLTKGLIAGPFKMALDAPGPIEQAESPTATPGVHWKPFEIGVSGLIHMRKLGVQAPPTDSTAYVLVEVQSPRDLQTELELAAHHDVKVWLNGKEVARRFPANQPRRFAVQLKAGPNRFLFKVHNIYGDSWLWARLVDPERVLSIVPPKTD
ncbi:MAG TPA: HEAT repeat domain-containing protein [Gemmatales bacterium]|nr:HEAT repeat domain-containing protein [Gemmatales bacterium]